MGDRNKDNGLTSRRIDDVASQQRFMQARYAEKDRKIRKLEDDSRVHGDEIAHLKRRNNRMAHNTNRILEHLESTDRDRYEHARSLRGRRPFKVNDESGWKSG